MVCLYLYVIRRQQDRHMIHPASGHPHHNVTDSTAFLYQYILDHACLPVRSSDRGVRISINQTGGMPSSTAEEDVIPIFFLVILSKT
jgi:hypothetical protein